MGGGRVASVRRDGGAVGGLDAAAAVCVPRRAAGARARVAALGRAAASGVEAEGAQVGARGVRLQGDLVPLALAGGARARGGVDVADGRELASVAVLVGVLGGVGEEEHVLLAAAALLRK